MESSRAESTLLESALALSYDGADYQGEMSALELAVVLQSINDLAQALSAADALGGATQPRVRVTAFNEGSFDIALLIEALGPGGAVITVAGSVGAGFSFWWKNMRRVVTKVVHRPDSGMVEVTMRDGEVMEWSEAQWRTYNNKRSKKAARGIASPLKNGASLTITSAREEIEVPASDAHQFDAPDDEPEEMTRQFEAWVYPDTVSFDPTKKWRLQSRSTGRFAATIEDSNFAADVALGRVRVGRNDTFKVALRSVTTQVDDGRDRVVWFVDRVIEHHQGAEQDALADDQPEGGQPS